MTTTLALRAWRKRFATLAETHRAGTVVTVLSGHTFAHWRVDTTLTGTSVAVSVRNLGSISRRTLVPLKNTLPDWPRVVEAVERLLKSARTRELYL